MEQQQSSTADPVDILIDESVAASTCEYREISYVRLVSDAEEEIDEVDAAGGPPEERSIDRVIARNLRDREVVRGRFTLAMLSLLGLVVGFALAASLTPSWSSAKDAILIVLPTVSGFVGFAVGFYFMTIADRG